MKTKNLLFLIAAVLLVAGGQKSLGETVPAGTTLIIRTLRTVTSADVPGTLVPAELERAITVQGKVAIPAGSHLSGKVVTSRRLASSNARLTVDFTKVNLAGRDVPITTTGAQLLSNDVQTKRGVSVSRSGYAVAAGKLMQFRLARPIVF